MSASPRFQTTLRLTGVSKRYHAGAGSCTASVEALRDVSVEIRAGEVLVVSGPPGAGKTTLLLCAAGLLRCDVGSVTESAARVAFVDLARRSPSPEEFAMVSVILIDSCDDIGELQAARLRHALQRALQRGVAIVVAARDANAGLAVAPPAATVTFLHLRLGHVAGLRTTTPKVSRVAEPGQEFVVTRRTASRNRAGTADEKPDW